MAVLKLGSTGSKVKELQILLAANGYNVPQTGEFDQDTEKVVRAFQQVRHLSVDGLAGDRTMGALRLQATAKLRVTEKDFQDVADDLGVDLAAVKAVQKVETGGRGGFFLPGKPAILFEGHVFWKQLKNPESHRAGNEDILYEKWVKDHYRGGMREYDRLEKACLIDKEAAYKSTSWGMFQIMGFNFKASGYPDVNSFVEDMMKNEGTQLKAFANFIKNNDGMHQALKKKNWDTFAFLYNGSGYKDNKYDELMGSAYETFKG